MTKDDTILESLPLVDSSGSSNRPSSSIQSPSSSLSSAVAVAESARSQQCHAIVKTATVTHTTVTDPVQSVMEWLVGSIVCIISQLTIAILVCDIAAFQNLRLIAYIILNDLLKTTYQAGGWKSQCSFPLLSEVSLPVLKIRWRIGSCHNSFIKGLLSFCIQR